MSTKPSTSWTRLLESLKLKRREPFSPDDLPKVGDDGLLAEPVEMPVEEDEEEIAAERAPGPLARLTRRDQTLTKLQEGYEQVTRLIEEIQKHLVAQGDRSERISTSLEQLARTMSDVPSISRQQAETLDTIASQMEASNTRTQKLADTLGELPEAARSQSEALGGINRQLEMAGEQNVVTAQTMEKLGGAVGMLGVSQQTQTDTLKQMNIRNAERNEMLSELIVQQSKRFTMLFVVTVVLATAAVAVGVLALVMVR